MTIGQKLRAYREARHWTITDVARRLKCTRWWVQRRENDQTECSASDLGALMRLYRLTDAQLVELVEAAS